MLLELPQSALLQRLERHGTLSEGAKAALLDMPITMRALESGNYIVREADAPRVCAILVSGFAYRQKITGAGARQIVAVCIPGDVVDLQNLYLDIADHSVQMLTDGALVVFQRTALQKIADSHPCVARAILIEVLLEASILREWIVNIGRRKAKIKLAHFLCEFATRLEVASPDTELTFYLPMSQEHLGDALGVTGEHVNRMLRALDKQGLIYRTKDSIRIPDWRLLRAAGDFGTRYLHLKQVE